MGKKIFKTGGNIGFSPQMVIIDGCRMTIKNEGFENSNLKIMAYEVVDGDLFVKYNDGYRWWHYFGPILKEEVE